MSMRMRNLLGPLVGMLGHGLKEIAVVREPPEAPIDLQGSPPEGTDSEVRTTCPDCGHDQFFEGPHGGMSVNVQCAGCGNCFNCTPGWPFSWEKIQYQGVYRGAAKPILQL